METKELIQELREDAEWAHANEWETPITLGDHLDAAADALAALHAQQERDNPKPLTLDELREMDGEPVWCVDGEEHSCYCLVNAESEDCIDSESGAWCFAFYGMTRDGENGLHNMGWLAYRSKPKEVQS